MLVLKDVCLDKKELWYNLYIYIYIWFICVIHKKFSFSSKKNTSFWEQLAHSLWSRRFKHQRRWPLQVNPSPVPRVMGMTRSPSTPDPKKSWSVFETHPPNSQQADSCDEQFLFFYFYFLNTFASSDICSSKCSYSAATWPPSSFSCYVFWPLGAFTRGSWHLWAAHKRFHQVVGRRSPAWRWSKRNGHLVCRKNGFFRSLLEMTEISPQLILEIKHGNIQEWKCWHFHLFGFKFIS